MYRLWLLSLIYITLYTINIKAILCFDGLHNVNTCCIVVQQSGHCSYNMWRQQLNNSCDRLESLPIVAICCITAFYMYSCIKCHVMRWADSVCCNYYPWTHRYRLHVMRHLTECWCFTRNNLPLIYELHRGFVGLQCVVCSVMKFVFLFSLCMVNLCVRLMLSKLF